MNGDADWFWAYMPKAFANAIPMSVTLTPPINEAEAKIHCENWYLYSDDHFGAEPWPFFNNPKPYDKTPRFVYWIQQPGLIFNDQKPIKFAMDISNANKDGFDLKMSHIPRDRSSLKNAPPKSWNFYAVDIFSWLPRKKEDFISGEFEITDKPRSGRIDFSAFKLKSPPKILGWGTKEFELKPGPSAYYVDITDISASGAKWSSEIPDYVPKEHAQEFKASLVYAKIAWLAQRTD